ncbi:MAG: hydroxypyruvate isomerase family protein [Cellvibrionaceae bacterium]
MKLCANLSMLFTEHALLDRFDAARDCDFSAVEIQFPYQQTLSELVRKKRENELEIALINLPAGDLMEGGFGLASHPKRRDAFFRAIEQAAQYAEALDVGRVNVLAGRTDPSFAEEHHRDVFLENLNDCANQLKTLGIKTVFEAINTVDMPDFLISRTDQMLQVISDLNHSHVAMQYDLYHMTKMQQPIKDQLPDIIQHIGHLQFADTPNRQQPGTGDLPFEELMSQLQGLNYQQWVGAEYHPSDSTADSLEWKNWYQENILGH